MEVHDSDAYKADEKEEEKAEEVELDDSDVESEEESEDEESDEDPEDGPAPRRFETFDDAKQFWAEHFEEELIPNEDLDLNCYLFNPNGEPVVPQPVKRAMNPRSLFNNQRPVQVYHQRWELLPNEEAEHWKEMWVQMRDEQREQIEEQLIEFRYSSKS
uniref:Uncharacterized protein n=1 Tax=Caenorhabditis elegans TaxID=6239 RepID=Q9TYK6_CAEEL|eukprot:NP_494652.1 Uncharacterized protein CELE_Y8A9A.3 [Caenorhabditis elegans]